MRVNRREAIVLTTAAGLAPSSLATTALASPADKAPELVHFPEPAVNAQMRSIEGLSNPAWFLRETMLRLLDSYRQFEEDSMLRDRPMAQSNEYGEAIDAHLRTIGSLRSMVRWSRVHGKPDRTLRNLIGDLGLCPRLFQVPHPDKVKRLREMQTAIFERANWVGV